MLTQTTPEQDHTTIVQQTYAAFGRGDIPALLAFVDPTIEWHTGGGAKTATAGYWRGHDGVRRFFAALAEHVKIAQFETRHFIAQNDKVAVIGYYAGTVNSTGREYASDWVMVFTFRDGRIVSFVEFTDSAAQNLAWGIKE